MSDRLNDMQHELDARLHRLAQAEAVLRRVEWAGNGVPLEDYAACCPCCEAPRVTRVHTSDCPLAALIGAERWEEVTDD